MNYNMILVMISECGNEIEIDHYRIKQFIENEDEFDFWKKCIILMAWEQHPEAQGFYWKDNRN